MATVERSTLKVFLALIAIVCCANAEASPAWLPAGLLNVAPVSQFVAGPTSMDWYHHDEPETVRFVSNRYCGDVGYATVIHLSCDKDRVSQVFTPTDVPEVGSCVLGSTVDWYEIYPGVGADAFTGTCYMKNADSCGAPECSNVELHISGTAFLVRNAFALSNPNVQANRDPKCKDVRDNRVAGGERRSGKHAHGWKNAIATDNTTKVQAASAGSLRSRPADLPDKVWTGYSYIYKGYFEAVSMREMRTVGSGSFELVWPIDRKSWYGLGEWTEVSSSTLPKEAMFIKNPYTATISYWDNSKSGHKKGHGRE